MTIYAACRYCRRSLTDPESQRRGYGPDCAAKRGLPHGSLNPRPRHGTPGDGQQALDLDAEDDAR